jgi:MoCo/4Fe-4S cofactor protein with predicted Tat translocation signal
MPDLKDDLIPEETKSPDPHYWRSFEQLSKDPLVIEASRHEFKKGTTDDFDPKDLSGVSRRKFLALLGASAALASAGCTDYRDKGEIIPYTNKPEELTLGKANYYASTAYDGSGILIKTREGRPIKIDGNPDHPISRGKVSSAVQAEILNLYNPERLQAPLRRGQNGLMKSTWAHADSEIIDLLSKNAGKEIALITHKIISPTSKKIIDDFAARYENVKVYSYDLFNDNARNSAWQKSGGSGTYPLVKWNEAKIIVSLEADFLASDGNKLENCRLFSESRNVEDLDNFSRLYVVEGNMSLTGMNADYRLRLRPDAQLEFVNALLTEFGAGGGNASLKSVSKKYNIPEKTLNFLVDDLRKNAGSSIVYAGKTLAEPVHMAVNQLNNLIGAANLFNQNSSEVVLHPYATIEEWRGLVEGMNNGGVGTVIIFDSNPAYHLPDDLGYADAVKKIPLVISLTGMENESSVNANYILPINHSLESWGDAKIRTGFYSLQQPVINPIFNTRQKEASLLHWTENNPGGFDEKQFLNYLMNFWEENVYPSVLSSLGFKQFWNLALHDGVVSSNEAASSFPNINFSSDSSSSVNPGGYAVILKENYNNGDGRFAHNGWLQELPHPVSKITWDNYAAISMKTAKDLDLKSNDLIEISIEERKIEIPIFIQPGSADDTITIELGYGRKKAGTIGTELGFDASALMSIKGGLSPWLYTGASIKKTGRHHTLVTAQEHHVFDDELTKDAAEKRLIIREGTVENYRNNPKFLHEGKGHELYSFYPEFEYTGVKWGMAIDMNKCIGCGDCVTACNSENNIPVVGKDQVDKGREMHWIRIDRYYSGSPDDPRVSNQVMLCQHCDHAPCENVCPVLATTHSPDGLNQMVYNRCVGTRYCSNNCPYKVRRFNYFNFRDHFNDGYQLDNLFNLVYNPEVTVRSRGVIEKCTFCIQRIAEARENASIENRALKGTDVSTACQEACPSSAIQFGDINDRDSVIAKSREHNLGYHVLEELNVRPNVTYLAKLRNTHTEEA